MVVMLSLYHYLLCCQYFYKHTHIATCIRCLRMRMTRIEGDDEGGNVDVNMDDDQYEFDELKL